MKGAAGKFRGARRTGGVLAVGLIVALAGCTSTGGVSTQDAGEPGANTPSSSGASASASLAVSTAVTPSETPGSSADQPANLTGEPATSQGDEGPTASAPSTAPANAADPASSPGNINETVDAGAEVVNPAVSVESAGDLGDAVSVRVSDISSVDVAARLPGEIGGNVVAVTLDLLNGSGRAISLDAVTVVLTDGAGNAASTVSSEPATPFGGALEAGQQKTAVYLFDVPPDARTGMSITVSSAAGTPAALFSGANSA